jgi:hypothetical protein
VRPDSKIPARDLIQLQVPARLVLLLLLHNGNILVSVWIVLRRVKHVPPWENVSFGR